MELRIFSAEDAAIMLDILTNTQVNRTYMLPDFETREDALPLFRRLMARSQDEAHFVRGIFADGTLVGFLNDVEIADGVIELGYVIHPQYWNRGYATGALKIAIADLFSLGFREVVCGAFEGNDASLRVMEKAGMRPLEKIDEIDYRGHTYRCFYRSIRNDC